MPYTTQYQNVSRPDGLKAEILSKIFYVIYNMPVTEVNEILYDVINTIQNVSYVEIPKIDIITSSYNVVNFSFDSIKLTISSFSM